jgi:hypothetical protein
MRIKSIMFLLLFLEVALAAIDLLPRKVRLLKKVGLSKTNDDLIRLAQTGDKEAGELYRRTKLWLWLMIPTGLLASFF